MLTISIDCSRKSDLQYHLQEIARLVEQGYTSGLVGEYGDSWYIDGEEEPFNDEEDEL